jgi:hypothetical protein
MRIYQVDIEVGENVVSLTQPDFRNDTTGEILLSYEQIPLLIHLLQRTIDRRGLDATKELDEIV